MTETQDKILDTAERLFGEQGYAGTSLRQIIAEAGVNLAAIHYHFGSKEELLDRLVQRKVGPVNAERMALLDEYEEEAGVRPVPIEKLLYAFLHPPLQRIKEYPDFARMMGRLYGEGLLPQLVSRHFETVVDRFTLAFKATLSHLTPLEVMVRLQFVVGAMAHTMLFGCDKLHIEVEDLAREFVSFATAGLLAPQPVPTEAMK